MHFKDLTAGAASKPLKMMIKMFNQNDTQSAAVFECEVDIFRGVIKMFLTGYQTDFGGYLTHFCTHTHSKETEDLSSKPREQDRSLFTSNNTFMSQNVFSRNNSQGSIKL